MRPLQHTRANRTGPLQALSRVILRERSAQRVQTQDSRNFWWNRFILEWMEFSTPLSFDTSHRLGPAQSQPGWTVQFRIGADEMALPKDAPGIDGPDRWD